jgi:signal peptidase I
VTHDRERRAAPTARRSRSLNAWLRIAVPAAVLAAGAAAAFGSVAVVRTNGTSMTPVYVRGDVVVVAAAASYAPGQIVAYRDHVHHLVVLHRIVGGDASGYVLRGDHNASVDAVRPAAADVVGRAVLHLPGAWLRRLPAAAAIAAVLLAVLVSHRRRRDTMPRHAAPLSGSPNVRTAARVTAAGGVLALALGAATWTAPVLAPAVTTERAPGSMTFSYAVAVPRSAAYDGTTARSPEPVFRRLARVVDVHFSYTGTPGSVVVTAELSAASGWRSTVPLGAATTFATSRYDGTVRLDLAALDRRALAAAAVTGVPAGPVAIAVVPRVTSAGGATFAPALRLSLTPLQLTVADAGMPAVRNAATVRRTVDVPRRVALLGRGLDVATGRAVSAGLLLAVLVAAAGIAVARTVRPRGGAVPEPAFSSAP